MFFIRKTARDYVTMCTFCGFLFCFCQDLPAHADTVTAKLVVTPGEIRPIFAELFRSNLNGVVFDTQPLDVTLNVALILATTVNDPLFKFGITHKVSGAFAILLLGIVLLLVLSRWARLSLRKYMEGEPIMLNKCSSYGDEIGFVDKTDVKRPPEYIAEDALSHTTQQLKG